MLSVYSGHKIRLERGRHGNLLRHYTATKGKKMYMLCSMLKRKKSEENPFLLAVLTIPITSHRFIILAFSQKMMY